MDIRRSPDPVVITINAGTSSVRLGAFAHDGAQAWPIANQRYETGYVQAGEDPGRENAPSALLRRFMQERDVEAVEQVVHRVVHGGAQLPAATLIDAAVEDEIARLFPLAPLHNPIALQWIRESRAVFGTDVAQTAVFDTGFYRDLPAVARTYAIPRSLIDKHGLRRYGFHGLAHAYMNARWRKRMPDGGSRIISLQLGAGCSITAAENGIARDTSMGFTPLEGLVMATRSGDIDPGLLLYLQRAEGWDADTADRILNQEAGLAGLSGESPDMRALLASDAPAARLALDVYCYRARKYIGAYMAALGGADAIVFGGGVGENAPAVRERILAGMGWCGIRLDAGRNAAATGVEGRISVDDAEIAVWVIPVDEAAMLVEHALALRAGIPTSA
jgi:acetate kinase